MDHIQDVYKKKPEMIEKIWDHLTKVNLKVDGKPFQVLYNDEEDELEFHGRSGNETKVGPLISDYERLFSKPINDAIAHIETRTDVFKKYKFLTFEVINEILLLTAIIKDNGEFVNSPAEIDKIAKELDTDVMPALWEGKISEEQKSTIMEVISTGIVPTKSDFIKWVKDLFGSYTKFPKKLISATDEFIEGIVFFFNVDGKIVEYKLVDPSYRQSMKDRDEASKQEQEKNAKYYEEIYNFFLDWSEENAKGEDDNRIVSIQKNFLNMMSDPKVHSKLMNLGSKIKINDSKTYTIQPERCCDEMKAAIKKYGNVYKNLFEKYIKLFYKAKKRGFVISKEFQDRVNKVVDKFADYSLNEDEIEINGEMILEAGGSYNQAFTIDTPFIDELDILNDFENNDESRKKYKNKIIERIFDGNKEQHKEFDNLIDKLYNKWIESEKGNILKIPFRFNSNNEFKICRDYYKELGFTSSRGNLSTIVDNVKINLGNGSIRSFNSLISTDEQESATCIVWNWFVSSCENNELKNLDIKDIEKICVSLSKNFASTKNNKKLKYVISWLNSIKYQVEGIFKFLKEEQKIKNLSDFRAVRYGKIMKIPILNLDNYEIQDDKKITIGKDYQKFIDIYRKKCNEKISDGEIELSGIIEKDSFDPSDIILFDYKHVNSNNFENLIGETPTETVTNYIKTFIEPKILYGVSLKQVGENPSIKLFNMPDGEPKCEITETTIIKPLNEETRGISILCSGKFNLYNLKVPDTNYNNNPSYLSLDFRTFGNYWGCECKETEKITKNDKNIFSKGISLGKVPVNLIKTKLNIEDTKEDKISHVIKAVENRYKEKNDKNLKEIKYFILSGIKQGFWCLPYILIH